MNDSSASGYNTPHPLPTFFLAGYQKCGTTWLHRCLLEHPDVYVPRKDAVHFFTIYYHRGFEWYSQFYKDYKGESQIGDSTPSYVRFPFVHQRIFEFNPNARIILSLRNPIDRAFSHYWHHKKKRLINFDFGAVFSNNVDVFDSWVHTGFYYRHIQELTQRFPKDRIKILIYEDLKTDPKACCREVFEFLGVDGDFMPSVIDRHVNKAWFRPTLWEKFSNLMQGRRIRESEYDRGIAPDVRRELREVFEPEIAMLSEYLQRDLSIWQ